MAEATRSLERVRTLFFAFSVAAWLSAVPSVLRPGAPALVRAVAIGGVAFVVWRRWREWGRRRLWGWPSDVAELVALLLVVASGGPVGTAAASYGSVFYRVVHASSLGLAMMVAGALGALVAGASVSEHDHIVHILPHVLGLTSATGLMWVLLSSLRDRDRELARERDFAAAVLESIDAGVIACDARGEITVFNRAARRLHDREGEAVAPEQWIGAFGLDQIKPAGTERPGALEDIPLYRALRGETIRGIEVESTASGEPHIAVVNAQPVLSGDGERLGAVAVMHDITERARAERRLEFEALHDPLTRLGNRAMLRDRLAHAQARAGRTGEPVAVLLVDVDEFKVVNDTRGHDVGDLVLVEVARRLAASVREGDTLVRLGGDEFAVLVEGASADEARQVADRLVAALAEPVAVSSSRFRLSLSVGIALHVEADDDWDLLRAADVAMYEAKASRAERVVTYAPPMRERVVASATQEAELRDAIEHDEIDLHYQPIVDLTSGEVVGFEALARWQHAVRGTIPPGAFIDSAERSGLIVQLGDQVLRRACRQAAIWNPPTGPRDLGPIAISVNLSARQLREPDIARTVLAVLDAASLEPSLLVIEVTETALMQTPTASSALRELQGAGVRVAIDDFGTGYSSLSRLSALRPQILKIDRSFIAGLPDGPEATIVRSVIQLAHNLSIATIAEGVEHADQLDYLRGTSCQMAQGFYFARPLDADAATRVATAGLVPETDAADQIA